MCRSVSSFQKWLVCRPPSGTIATKDGSRSMPLACAMAGMTSLFGVALAEHHEPGEVQLGVRADRFADVLASLQWRHPAA